MCRRYVVTFFTAGGLFIKIGPKMKKNNDGYGYAPPLRTTIPEKKKTSNPKTHGKIGPFMKGPGPAETLYCAKIAVNIHCA